MADPKSPARPTWQRAYYALGAFNVLSVMAAIALSDRAMAGFTHSVGENQRWAHRAGRYVELAQTVARADGPGNDVFESHDVAGESARLDAIMADYERQHAAALRDLRANVDPAVAAPVIARLEASHGDCTRMAAEAREIFAAFRAQRPEEAGRHMAAMDRFFSRCNEALAAALADVRRAQASQFAAQQAESQGLRRYEYGLAALVALIVVFIAAYGAKLARVFARQQAVVDATNRDMRLLLENVEQGFLTLDASGRVTGERSAPVDRWLGAVSPGEPFSDALGRVDASAGTWFGLGWEGVTEDVLPLEVVVDQLPNRVVLGERTLRITYKPILRGTALDRMLVVVTDVTAIVEQERAEALQREVLTVLDAVIRDRNGFLEFVTEAEGLVEQITAGDAGDDLLVVRRVVHTLKGNFGIYGLASLVDYCHRLEARMLQDEDLPTASERAELRDRWRAFTAKVQPLLARRDAGIIEITEAERRVLLESIRAMTPHRDLGRMVAEWTFESMEKRLARIGAHVQALARRLGKGAVRVDVVHHNLRLPMERWAPFWAAFTHVVRNAVDHGIETEDERAAAGKLAPATVTLTSRVEGEYLEIELRDDGRGIDFDRVREKAKRLGLPCATREDLVEALFHDGFSTRDEVTDTSGRGVGLSAVRNAARELGGDVVIETARNEGTTFRVRVPHERRWSQGVLAAFTSGAVRPSVAPRMLD